MKSFSTLVFALALLASNQAFLSAQEIENVDQTEVMNI